MDYRIAKYTVTIEYSKSTEVRCISYDTLKQARAAYKQAIKDNGGYHIGQLTKEADLYKFPNGDIAFSEHDNVNTDYTDIAIEMIVPEEDGVSTYEKDVCNIRLYNQYPVL